MRWLAAMACGFVTLATPAAAQQQWPDIFQIVDQFMISNAITSKCVKPDADKLYKFLENFQIVTATAAVEMKKHQPDVSPEQVDKFMHDRYEEIDQKVSGIITQETCDGPKIKEALRRFDVQAGMDLLGGAKPN